MMHITNRYNFEEYFIIPPHDVQFSEEYVDVPTKATLIHQINTQSPIGELFPSLASDTDLSKLTPMQLMDWLRDNPDAEPTPAE